MEVADCSWNMYIDVYTNSHYLTMKFVKTLGLFDGGLFWKYVQVYTRNEISCKYHNLYDLTIAETLSDVQILNY